MRIRSRLSIALLSGSLVAAALPPAHAGGEGPEHKTTATHSESLPFDAGTSPNPASTAVAERSSSTATDASDFAAPPPRAAPAPILRDGGGMPVDRRTGVRLPGYGDGD